MRLNKYDKQWLISGLINKDTHYLSLFYYGMRYISNVIFKIEIWQEIIYKKDLHMDKIKYNNHYEIARE